MLETNRDARMAALGATRQMITDDQFDALVAILVDVKAIPRNVMAAALQGLADGLIAKARSEMESDRQIFPMECFDRARELNSFALRLRGS